MIALFFIINLINLLLTNFMIFIEHKRLHRVAIWLFVFALLPIVGFLIYLLIGIGVIKKTSKFLNINFYHPINNFNLNNLKLNNSNVKFNILNHSALCLDNKNIEIFSYGTEFFNTLKKDILNSKHCIYLLSYIFANDIIGNEIKNLLIKKAKEGVKIIVIYDSVGSKKTSKKFFKSLKKNGVKVYEFFPPFLKLGQLNINYRNHRKIIIIDNKFSYIGGLNIRDDHLGKNLKLTPWRDTHLKIEGKTTLELLKVFLQDLKLCDKNFDDNSFIIPFSDFKNTKLNFAQVINCGPLNKGEQIEESFINLINSAKHEIIIQSPYLVLDDKFFTSLKLARLRGVKVKIFIPKLVDKPFVYNATLFNAKKLIEIGIDIYLYNGFLHSKTMLLDASIFVAGSCNFDMRSFYLNFETSVIVYSKKVSLVYYKILQQDMLNSTKLNSNFYKKLPTSKKLAISFCNLFSPIV